MIAFVFGLYAEENLPRIDRHKFDDVLLIVNYNHSHYDSIPFIKELYKPLFPNIVFYGEDPHPDVNNAELYFGVYCTRVLGDALARFPNYRGYVFLQDDCMLNVWNFSQFDLDKLWLAISRYPYAGSNNDPPPPSWDPNYDKKEGHQEFIHASILGTYREHWGWWVPHVYGIQAVQKAVPYLEAQFLGQLEKNVGENIAVAQACDMFYIPQKFRKQAIVLSRIFSDVFYEISIPMMFCCLDSIDHWEIMKMYWGFTQEHFLDYRTDVHWLHPLKFSKDEHREFVSEKLNNYYKTLQ